MDTLNYTPAPPFGASRHPGGPRATSSTRATDPLLSCLCDARTARRHSQLQTRGTTAPAVLSDRTRHQTAPASPLSLPHGPAAITTRPQHLSGQTVSRCYPGQLPIICFKKKFVSQQKSWLPPDQAANGRCFTYIGRRYTRNAGHSISARSASLLFVDGTAYRLCAAAGTFVLI